MPAVDRRSPAAIALEKVLTGIRNRPDRALLVLLSVISGITSATGLWHLAPAGGRLAAVLFVIVVQALLVWALLQYRRRRKEAWLLFYFGLASLSVISASATWSRLLGLDRQHAQLLVQRAARLLNAQFSRGAIVMSTLSDYARTLAERSRRLADLESAPRPRYRPTCDIDASGPGPRSRYRRKVADELAYYAERFAQLEADYRDFQHRASALAWKDDPAGRAPELELLVSDANAILNAPEIAGFTETLLRIQKHNAGSHVLFEGAVIRCPLPQVEHVLRALQKMRLPSISMPRLAAEGSGRTRSFLQAAQTFSLFITGQWSRLTVPEIAGMMIGSIVDLAILLVALSARTAMPEPLRITTPHIDREAARTLVRCAVPHGRSNYDVYLVDRQGAHLLAWLEHNGCAVYRGRKPGLLLPRHLRGEHGIGVFQPVECYRVPRELMCHLRSSAQ